MWKQMLYLGGCVLFNSLAHVLLKYNAVTRGSLTKVSILQIKTTYLQPLFIAAILCFGLSVIFYNHVLTRLNLSFAFPLLNSMTYVMVIFLSIIIFHESVSLFKLSGILLIIAGITIVSI